MVESGQVDSAGQVETVIRELEVNGQTVVIHQDPYGFLRSGIGATVWDAAIVLARYFLLKGDREKWRDLRVIELGAGTGCVGLTLASLGANVWLSDLPWALRLLNMNVAANAHLFQIEPNVVPLSWGDNEQAALLLEHAGSFDLIVVSDCVHWPELFEKLIDTMDALSTVQTAIYLSYEVRNFSREKEFFALAKQRFLIDILPKEELDPEFCCDEIIVFRLRRRPTPVDS